MARYSRVALAALITFSMSAGAALAGEATMRMRGGTQTFTGELLGFDGESYFVETPVFGKVYLDAKRFECISGDCPRTVTSGTAAPVPDNAVPAGNNAAPTADNVTPRQDYGEAPPQMDPDKQRQLFMEFLEWRKSRGN